MRSIFYFSSRLKLVAIAIIIVGVLFIAVRGLQMSTGIVGYNRPTPLLYIKNESIKIYLEGIPPYIAQAFKKAVRDWDRAVEEFNFMKDIECSLERLVGCSACLREPRLPRIEVVEKDGYNVVVESSDVMPKETIIAYTEPYINGGLLARIVVWSSVPEHRAYQVAVHEISRLYGIDIPEVHKTLFGAVPAGSNTVKLNPSMEQFMNGPPDPMKPTTLDLYIAYEDLKNPGVSKVIASGIVFRAYDEPDFTLPALISPLLITLGTYFLFTGGRRNV